MATSLFANDDDISLNREARDFLAGRAFEKRVQQNMLANWSGVPLRAIVRSISDERNVAILLDRRLDPNTRITLTINNQPLTEVCRLIGQKVNGTATVVGNTIYIGPLHSAKILKTLAGLSRQQAASKLPGRTRSKLSAKRSQHWPDLQVPSELVTELAESAGITIKNEQTIPHDLWPWGSIENCSGYESLALLLIQFDLSVSWTEEGSVSLVSLPAKVQLTRRIKPRTRGLTVQDLLQQSKTALDDDSADLQIENGAVVVSGTIEQLDLVDAIARGRSLPKAPAAGKVIPLAKREFTLQARAVRASDLIQQLIDSGITIEWDKQKFADAGIDLQQSRLKLNVTEARANEFFQQICGQLSLSFRIRGNTVTLSVKK